MVPTLDIEFTDALAVVALILFIGVPIAWPIIRYKMMITDLKRSYHSEE
jgi:hypothetical protein